MPDGSSASTELLNMVCSNGLLVRLQRRPWQSRLGVIQRHGCFVKVAGK